MDSETAHLMRCLQQIHKVIGKANEILAGVSHPSVCSEVLLSPPGTAYILGELSARPWFTLGSAVRPLDVQQRTRDHPWINGRCRQALRKDGCCQHNHIDTIEFDGTYFLGLSEVYRISKRLEDGIKTQKISSELLQRTLRDVDIAWNNLLAFLALGHSVFQLLNLQLLEPSLGSEPCLSAPHLAPSQVCGVCLSEVKQEPEVHSGNSDPVRYQDSYYHASCANFWLNCVDSTLPRQT